MSNSEGPKILFQLTGSIACFKACELISRLAKRGMTVQTVASAGALRFVGAATLEGLTGRSAVHRPVRGRPHDGPHPPRALGRCRPALPRDR